MSPELQTILSVSVPTLAVLIGILVNNSRLNDFNTRFTDTNTRLNEMSAHFNSRFNDMNKRLDDIEARMREMRAHFDQRIDDMKETWRSELKRVEEIIDARLTHLEGRMR